MTAAEEAYARLQAAERSYEMMSEDQRRFVEGEVRQGHARQTREMLIKRKLPRFY